MVDPSLTSPKPALVIQLACLPTTTCCPRTDTLARLFLVHCSLIYPPVHLPTHHYLLPTPFQTRHHLLVHCGCSLIYSSCSRSISQTTSFRKFRCTIDLMIGREIKTVNLKVKRYSTIGIFLLMNYFQVITEENSN